MASSGIIIENRFACNFTVFQVNLTEVEGARAGPDRTGPGSLLPVWPGAFYMRGQGPSTCVAKEPATCVVKEPSTCVARGPSVCVDREPSICVAKELSTCVVKEPFTCGAKEPSTQGKILLISRCGSHTG